MNQADTLQSKISARDRARRLMNGLTAGVAILAVAGVGALGYVSAATVPGSTSAATAAATTNTSSGSGVAVSGGS